MERRRRPEPIGPASGAGFVTDAVPGEQLEQIRRRREPEDAHRIRDPIARHAGSEPIA